jgi:hypothetical protein
VLLIQPLDPKFKTPILNYGFYLQPISADFPSAQAKLAELPNFILPNGIQPTDELPFCVNLLELWYSVKRQSVPFNSGLFYLLWDIFEMCHYTLHHFVILLSCVILMNGGQPPTEII